MSESLVHFYSVTATMRTIKAHLSEDICWLWHATAPHPAQQGWTGMDTPLLATRAGHGANTNTHTLAPTSLRHTNTAWKTRSSPAWKPCIVQARPFRDFCSDIQHLTLSCPSRAPKRKERETELKCWNREQFPPNPWVWPLERQTTTPETEINPVPSFSTVLGHLWHRMGPDLPHPDCRSPGMPMQTKETEGPMTWCLHRPAEQLLWVLLPPVSLEACFYFRLNCKYAKMPDTN